MLVDADGVGYEVDVPMSTFYNLPPLGEPVTLLTHFVVREDAQQLFGFLTADERATFRLLVKISGVGPRTALSILSGLSVAELAQAVSTPAERPAGQGAGHRQEDGRAAAARTEGQARRRTSALPPRVHSDAQADILQALRRARLQRPRRRRRAEGAAGDVGVADGIKLALKALAR